VTESEWKSKVETMIRDDARVAELKIEIERSCWRFLTKLRDGGMACALKVTIDPIRSSE
jgi:hypothetical protein